MTLRFIILFACNLLLLTHPTSAETLTFSETDQGKCMTFEYDAQTGMAVTTEYTTGKCSASWLTKMAGSIGQYGIVVKNKDAGMFDYDWTGRLSIKKLSDRTVAKHKISGDNKVKLDLAIKNKKKFNVGYFTSAYWVGGLYSLPEEELIAQKEKITETFDDESLKAAFNEQDLKTRKQIQTILKIRGHYSSSIDGLYGKGTLAALKSYGSETVSSSGLSQATLVKSVMRNLSSEVKLLSAIRVSDDLTKYQKQMYLGVARLVKDKKCDLREIEYFGGWVKSGQRKGQYFMDCGNTRHWLNPANNSAKVTTARHISESAARDMCWAYVRREIPGASMQAFNTSFTKHTAGAVTYTAGFKAKNVYGNTLKYYAYCLIQPDRSMEVTFKQR